MKVTNTKIKELVFVLIGYAFLYLLVAYFLQVLDITPERIHTLMGTNMLLVAPVVVSLQVLASLTPIPDTPFLIIGVLFFPVPVAFFLVWLGMLFASVINFYVARKLGRKYVLSRYPKVSEWVDSVASKYGFVVIAAGRSFTFVTFDLMAYASGISNIKFQTFILATAVGLIPVTMNAILLGLAFTRQEIGQGIIYFAISGGFAILIGIASKFWIDWSKKIQTR